MVMLTLHCGTFDVEVEDIRARFSALDADRRSSLYEPIVFYGDPQYLPASVVHIVASSDGEPRWRLTIAATGGSAGVHEHAALCGKSNVILLVGPFAVSVRLDSGTIAWAQQCDPGACFGIHRDPTTDAFFVHGEQVISKLSSEGQVLWTTWGKDIFTGPMTITGDQIRVEDFQGNIYRIQSDTGHSAIVGHGTGYPHTQ